MDAKMSKEDALGLQVLQLQVEKAQLQFDAMFLRFKDRFSALSEKYGFDPETCVVNFDSLQIEERK